MRTPAKTEHRLLHDLEPALRALAEKTGLKARVLPRVVRHADAHGEDAVVAIAADGNEHRYVVETKTRVDRAATLGHIKAQAQLRDKPVLLFAPYITAAIAKQCRELDLAFLDTAGNAYLRLPDVYVYITGEKPAGGMTPTALRGAGTAAALRVIFALLCNPALLNAPYREIVKAAGVALGAVGLVFLDLEKRGYIVGNTTTRNRRLIQPTPLFDEWVMNYPIKLRPKLHPRRFRTDDPTWWQNAKIAEIGAFWGGEVAAYRLTQHLKPATYTLYVPGRPEAAQATTALTQLVAAHRLRADPNGNIEILDAFWHLPQAHTEPDVVPPLLAYADLVATHDTRNIEAAQLIRERHIDHALRAV